MIDTKNLRELYAVWAGQKVRGEGVSERGWQQLAAGYELRRLLPSVLDELDRLREVA